MSIGISSIGVYKPNKILTNHDISKIIDTNDEWIFTRTGIKQRHIADKNENVVDMALNAVEHLFEYDDVLQRNIDLIICSTTTHDRKFPSVSALIQEKLKIPNIPTFDIGPACAGFVYLLATAEAFIESGFAKKVLCLCPEKMSSIIDWSDRNTCVLFGDAAAAFIIEKKSRKSQILKTIIGGDGFYKDLLYTEEKNGQNFVKMNGTQVFKKAVQIMTEQVHMVCSKAGKKLTDIDLLIPHQANTRIMMAVAEKLGIPFEKSFMNVELYGNTSSATIPLALYDAEQKNILEKGMLIATPALGGGFAWGASLIQY